jgi:hypothetical protein
MSAATTSLAEARTIFGTFRLGPDDVGRVLGSAPSTAAENVPFARADLERARARGEVLVLRTDAEGDVPLTLGRLIERFPETLQPGLRKGVGYQLKDEWTVLQEPLTGSATCRPGWALVHASPIAVTCNLNYEQQDGALARYDPDQNGATFSRRSAVEAAYDTILLHRAHARRLLIDAFDWSDTPTQDGGFVTVGQFEEDGLRIVGYSRAVRFGTLGVCPQRRA